MSEVAHDNWKNVKTIYRFHELVFYIWDNHLECFNRDTRDIELEASCSQIQGAHPARAPSKIGENMIFWRKIVIFYTKYHKNFRASLRSAQFF